MSCMLLSLLILVVAGSLDARGGAIAKQPSDPSSGSISKVVPLPASARHMAESVAAALAVQLPNGASSISEAYGEWAVNCRLIDRQKQCVLLQSRGNSQTGQLVFAIGLRTPGDGNTVGTILTPFGLKLDSGAILKLDDKELGQALRFSTCVPEGCLLPVSFPRVAIDAMKKAKVLTVASVDLVGGEVVTFNISLEGFAAAIARLVELGR
jgi:invasion protein IalB